MEDFEHSVRGPQVSATLSRKTSNGNGFTAKAVYDDVFGGPPKFGVRTFSSRVEDYSEIFGSFHSSRGSSIPILDLPVVDDGEVYSSKLDYCEIFGGFNGVDFAVSYEELFADPNKGGECSSEEAWTPGETGSVSEGSDSLACSERDQSLSNGASCNQFDGVNQFNLSFHKATQSSSNDGINGATHIAQLHAIPGYTFMVDEITHPQVTESNNPLPHVSDDSNQDMNFTEGGTEGKNFRKTNSFSPTSNAGVQTWESDVKSQKGYGRSVSISNEAFLTISEINLTTQPCLVPPPSRPPPKFAIKRGDSNISMGSRIKASHGRAVSDCSASYLDVEVDASSSAAASAAAMKEAMDKAQARIRSARESMEKKRDGIQNRRKLDLTDDLKRKDRDEGRAADGTNKLREERVQETCESANKGKRASAGEEMGKATRPDQVAREFEDREIFRTVPKESLQEEHGKESRSSQEFHRQEGSECKASNRFCELENADKSRAAFRVLEQEKTEKKIVQSTKPLNCKESKKKEAEEAFELEQANYMKLTGDEEAIRLPQESCMKLEAAKEALQREKKEIKTEAGDSSQKGEELKKKLKGAQGIPEPDGFDKLGVAMELKETEMKLEETHAQEKCEKKLKGAYEQKEKGKKLKEAREQEENVQKQKKAERQQNETRLKMFYESEEDERRLKQACEWEENEKRLKEAHLHGENESRLKEALEWEEKEKRVKDSYLREENEKKLKKACKQQESEKKLKEACEQEENEKRLKEACWWEENEKQKEACVREESEKKLKEAHDGEEYGEKLKESFEKEEHERRLKELHKQEDNENRPKKACEPEENEKRLKEVYVQEENEKRLKDASECEENETRQKEAYEREENEKRLEEANEREEVEGKLKVAYKACDHKEEKNLKISNEVFMNLKATKESSGDEEYDQELEDIREALEHIESGKIMRKDVVSSELPENGKESIPAKVSIELEGKERLETVKTSGLDQASHDNKQNENTLKVATEACPSDESEMKLGEHDMDVRRQVENIEKVSQVPFEREKIEKRKTHELPGDVNNVKEAHAAFDQEENKNNLKTTQVSSTRSSENGTKMESYLGANMSDKNKTTKRAEDININQNVERKERSCNGTITIEEREKKEKMQRERELEKERLRKIEEERDREREREKDRMAVERATREARERAFADARERAERAAVERATAEARQRAMAEAREKLEKASAEAREKSLSEKAYMEARLRAERAAVERATAEARERAVEKAMAERAASEARERSERFTGSKDGGMKQSSSSSDMQDPQFQSSGSFSGSRYPNYSNNGGAEGESAQRCKARLERHQRTVQRAAKALAEKNLRDLLAQREQAERNRLAETLDADVKRWSNGKEGNLRALLSTLQYILGPDSGWQPIPLTDVITAVAVKKAYRKATLCVHPDKLQQRGASIQQKYICEKVFDLLKEAWNKFNSEER